MNIISLILWSLAIIALTAALFATMIRLVGGPNTLDRLISLDATSLMLACLSSPTLPAISAGAANRTTCQSGKFQGMMARTIPSGEYRA